MTQTLTESPEAPKEQTVFGHINSLTRAGEQYKLRFDPAWFLSGETANTAAAEGGAVAPGDPVPNDNYRVDESHRLYTYLVPPSAEVTVLVDGPQGEAITVDQLAAIVAGTSELRLFEPLETGVWLRVDIDTVRSIAQQYQP